MQDNAYDLLQINYSFIVVIQSFAGYIVLYRIIYYQGYIMLCTIIIISMINYAVDDIYTVQ